MKKRMILLVAAVLLALPLGGSVAMAQGGGNGPDVSGDTGAACPEASPQGVDEDPSCGEEGKGGEKGQQGNNGNNGQGNDGQGNDGETGNACPPNSPDTDGDGKPNCGAGDDDDELPDTETDCEDGVDNDEDGLTDGDDPDCQEAPDTETDCEDGVDNDEDGLTDGDDPDCQEGTAGVCTEAGGDAGLVGDPIGKQLYDGGLSAASPLVEDPEADGAITGEVYAGGKGTPLEPVTNEVACTVDTLIDPESGLPDL